ncbi:UDP-N-acetylglucosamine 1-carboxyvinyltransferase, partial [Candidatus Dependentiae bacterium]
PLLGRFGKATVVQPGGCPLGGRPIDYHIRGFSKLGACFKDDSNSFSFELLKDSSKEVKREFFFEYPSVGATENLLMCAAGLEGTTTLVNASFEPEVLALVDVLSKMGVEVDFAWPHTMIIHGFKDLEPVDCTVIPDRIEAGSLLCAIAATGGKGGVANINAEYMGLFIEKFKEMGHSVKVGSGGVGVWIESCKNPKAVNLKTAPYPGFPTDLQSTTMAAMLNCSGSALVDETVFSARFSHVPELCKMGADISVIGQKATMKCGKNLCGAEVVARDIRAGYALLIAGMLAEGQTRVFGVDHIRRGYHKFDEKLNSLGASVKVFHD